MTTVTAPQGVTFRKEPRTGALLTAATWIIGVLFVLPVLWIVLTSFHSETDAATNPPSLGAPLSLESYRSFFDSGPWPPLANSLTASVLSTVLVLLLAFPAAYALSIKPVKKWTDVLFFFLSTTMLPVVAGLLPIYLFARKVHLLDNIWLLIVLYTAINLPIVVWMLRDVVAPVVVPGIAAAALISFIFSWNELLFARVLTATVAQAAPVFLTGFVTSQGLFLAKVCAASLVVSLPVLIAGFAAQDKLAQGLSMGAVK